MRILITNDDGILAPGIEALYQAVKDLGEVHVVAPATPQSAVGHAITLRTPIQVHHVHVNNVFHGWSVDGRPADCVKLAIREILTEKPDFVLSGINAGANTGINTLYSGTVAGAAEGALFDIPSMAFSLELSDELDFPLAGKIARRVFQSFLSALPPGGTCLSVNIPSLDQGMPRGIRCCRQSIDTIEETYNKQVDAHDQRVYWLSERLPEMPDTAEDTDIAAVRDRYVAVTPLRFDLTDTTRLAEIARWTWRHDFE